MRKWRMAAAALALLLVLQLVPGQALAAGELMAHENFAIGAYTRNDIDVAAGNTYVLTVATADTLDGVTEETLLYIGAVRATAEDEAARSITFHNVRLRRLVQANYFVTGMDAAGNPLPGTPEASGTLEVIGRIAAEYPGAFRLTMIDEFGYYYAGDAVTSDTDGAFSIGGLAPGRYKLRVDRQGYVPLFYAPPGGEYLILTEDYTAILADIDVSARLGDVDGDGMLSRRDLSALVGILTAGGYTAAADLTGDGAVDGADLARLVIPGGPIASGLDGAEKPTLTADAAPAEDEGVYTLALTLTDRAETMLAAGVTLVYDSDVLALCDGDGNPIDPSSERADGAFAPAAGLLLTGVNQSETDGRCTVTLQVCAAAGEPSAEDALGTFGFMLRPGMNEDDLYTDSIVVQAAWAAGETTMARSGQGEDTLVCIEHPVSPALRLAELTLTGAADALLPVYYPAVNRPDVVNTSPTAVPFTLVGQSDSGKIIPLSAVDWHMTADDPTGLELIGGVLYVSDAAHAGTVTLRATARGVTSNEVSLTLTKAPSTPTIALIHHNDVPFPDGTVKIIQGVGHTFNLTASIYDQYNKLSQAAVVWSAPEGLPAGATLDGGTVTIAPDTKEGHFIVTAESGPAVATLQITLQRVASLTLSGASSVAIPPALKAPNQSEKNTTAAAITLTVAAFDADGVELLLTNAVTWSLAQSNDHVTIVGEAGSAHADLQVKPTAQPGTISVVAALGNIQASRSVSIAYAPAEGYRMVLKRGGKPLGASDAITASASYTAQVYDQYDRAMSNPGVRWSGSPPTGVTINATTGAVTVGANAKSGTFTLRAICDEAVETVSVSVTPPTVNQPDAGGGGSPGAANPQPSPTDVPYSPDGAVMATLTPTASETAPGRFEAKLTDEEITASIVRNGTLIVRPQFDGTAEAVTLTLTGTGAGLLARHADNSIALETPNGTVKLTAKALAAAGQGLRLTMRQDGALSIAEVSYGDEIRQSVAGGVLLTLPTASGTAVLVDADGGETVIRKSAVVDGRMRVALDGSATVKLVDRAVGFSDSADHWASASIAFAAARELVRGVDDGSAFAPGMTMTRGMLVTVLHRLENEPAAKKPIALSDVPDGSWYHAAMNWAGEVGIVNVSTGIAVPEQNITREQIATMLYRYAAALGLDTSARKSLTAFPDAALVSEYADEAMRWAVAVGLVTGKSDGRLDPPGSATRAEVVTMLERFVVFLVREL